MGEVSYVIWYAAGSVALGVTAMLLVLPSTMFITARLRHEFAKLSYDMLYDLMSAERFEGHPTAQDMQVLEDQYRIMMLTQSAIDSGEADDMVLAKDIVMNGYIKGNIHDQSPDARFTMRWQRQFYGNISCNRLAARLQASTGITRTRVLRIYWVGLEFAYLMRMSLTHYFKPVWNQLYSRGAAWAGLGTVAGALAAAFYWNVGQVNQPFSDVAGTLITVFTFLAYDCFCVREFVKVARVVRAQVTVDTQPKPKYKWRFRDKVMIGLLPVVMIFDILCVRYNYNYKLMDWAGHEFSHVDAHIQIHVPNYVMGSALLSAVGLGCLVAICIVAKKQFVKDRLIQSRLYASGTISLLLVFGFVSAWAGAQEAIYGVELDHRLPDWTGWPIFVLLYGGMVSLAAGRVAVMVQNRRIFRREVGRPHRWQPKIWFGVAATWISAMVGLITVLGIAAENDVKRHQDASTVPLPGYVMPATFVIVGSAWAVTIALLVVRKARKDKEQEALGTARRQKMSDIEPPKADDDEHAHVN